MSFERPLPRRYEQAEVLLLCSNRLEDIEIPLAFHDQPLLLVGKGNVPLVWLAAPSSPGSHDLDWIVKESSAVNPAIDVRIEKVEHRVSARVGGVLVIEATATGAEIEVSHLDLRPLGFDVEGNNDGLRIGGSTLSQNTVRGAGVAFALG